jgi:hypothetical protein
MRKPDIDVDAELTRLAQQRRQREGLPTNGHAANNGAKIILPNAGGESSDDLWPTMRPEAYRGVAGDVVAAIEPHTESDSVAILLQLLVCFGNAIGRGPYYQVEGDRHATNLYSILIGQSSKARKGTSMGRVRQIMKHADREWERERILGGLSSGEGLIACVQDAEEGNLPLPDKRALMLETEYANVLTVARREGNTLSRVIRDGWDTGNLGTLTKEPLKATGALISVIGHITAPELRTMLDQVSMANGFANRNLYAVVKRSKVLPHGGNFEEMEAMRLGKCVSEAIAHAKDRKRMILSASARTYWEEIYPELSRERSGLFGAIVERAEAQTIRLAMLYALLAKSEQIDVEHLESAYAVWDYSEASVRFIYGDALGDPIADEILGALRRAADGMTRTEISGLFSRHVAAGKIAPALKRLEECGLATSTPRPTAGRPIEVWFAAALMGSEGARPN